MSESFYNILGIDKTASHEEIKKAYRSKSLKYHPDKNSDPGATDMFQKVTEAYETLGDHEKRERYDNVSGNPFSGMGGMGGMHAGMYGMPGASINVEDLFQNIFGMGPEGMQGAFHGAPPGFHSAPFGNVRVFQNGVPMNMNSALQKPSPIVKTIIVNMEQVMTGANLPLEIERWILQDGSKVFEKETIYVEVPKGVDENEIIIIRERGNAISDNHKGDIKIFVKINNTTYFKRNGLDIIYEKTISLKEALCGFTFELKHINGKTYTINNNEGSIVTPAYFKAIPDMGLSRNGHTGNLVITFEVLFPESLKSEQIQNLKTIL
tara:strand:+ start:1922 stop:2887 length:966 start_codon:yes stop_codon:yes gene_type:complete